MPEKWTGDLVGRMHNARVTYDEMAAELGVSKPYISMILTGARKPEGIKERMEAALDKIMHRKEELDNA